jgi:hypothetical protein
LEFAYFDHDRMIYLGWELKNKDYINCLDLHYIFWLE